MKSAHNSEPAILILEIVHSQQRRSAGKRKINFIFSSCWPCQVQMFQDPSDWPQHSSEGSIQTAGLLGQLKPFDAYPYRGRTAPLTSKRCILYIYSTNIGTEYFKHGIYSVFFPSKCSLFHNSKYLVPVLFTFYIIINMLPVIFLGADFSMDKKNLILILQ